MIALLDSRTATFSNVRLLDAIQLPGKRCRLMIVIIRHPTIRPARLRSVHLLLATTLISAACATAKQAPRHAASTPAAVPEIRVVRETVTARDTTAERRIGQLEFQLLVKEAQLAELQSRLEDTRDEVVLTMAKLKTAASRAEAASGMAEAEVALQSLRASGQPQAPEVMQANKLMQQSSAEFNRQNYGGALYLAQQARTTSVTGGARLTDEGRSQLLAGETRFALPLRFRVGSRGNVRAGPGTNFPVTFTVEVGAELTGYSHSDEWIKITDPSGRNGWIFRNLVARS